MNKKDLVKKLVENRDHLALLTEGAKQYKKENYVEAIEYYRLAATLGNRQAACNLGYCYMYGRSVEKDLNMAYNYFEIASDGCIEALYKIGEMYEEGIVVEKSDEIAGYYYNKAIKIVESQNDEYEFPSLLYKVAKRMIKAGEKVNGRMVHYLSVALSRYQLDADAGCNYYVERIEDIKNILAQEEFVTYISRHNMTDDDDVILTEDYNGIPAGTKGTIVIDYSDVNAEVEFFNEEGKSLGEINVPKDLLRLVEE